MKPTIEKKEIQHPLDDCSDDPANPGKSPIVRVTFTPPETFEYSCSNIKMRAAGKIQFHQASPNDPWVFVRPNGLPESGFCYETAANGKTMTIRDKYTDTDEHHYSLTVCDDTGEHTSSDRIITNPPMIRNL